MTITQIRCFLQLVSAKRLSEAAGAIDMPPSTVHKYVESLGDEFGVKLLQKDGNSRYLRLTSEGKLLYPGMQYISNQYDAMLSHLRKTLPGKKSVITLAVMFHQTRILRHLDNFIKENGDIEINVIEYGVDAIREMLDYGNANVAVIYSGFLKKSYPNTLPLWDDELMAVVSRKHPLAKRGLISVEELKNELFLLFRDEEPMYQFQLQTCISVGFAPAIALHSLRSSSIMECVSNNYGVTLLMENVVRRMKNDNVVILPLKEKPLLTMSLVFVEPFRSGAAERLRDYMIEHKDD
jgi:DNA-binding transcriptional LysR family regulator